MSIPLLTNLFNRIPNPNQVKSLTGLLGYNSFLPLHLLPLPNLDVTGVSGRGAVNTYSVKFYNEFGADGNHYITY